MVYPEIVPGFFWFRVLNVWNINDTGGKKLLQQIDIPKAKKKLK